MTIFRVWRTNWQLIEQGLKEGTPLLGICLGSQLIAKALGAKVYRNVELEIGWERVWLTDAGKRDTIFGGTAVPRDIFSIGTGRLSICRHGAEWLAYSEKCRHQAYRYGPRVYGIQFHPEITAEMIADWCGQPVNCGDVATLREPIDPCHARSWCGGEKDHGSHGSSCLNAGLR